MKTNGRNSVKVNDSLATLRAFAGGLVYLGDPSQTLESVAKIARTTVSHVRAAVTLLKDAEYKHDAALIDHVLRREFSLLAAAAAVEPFVRMLINYERATPANRVAFHRAASDLPDHLVHCTPAERTEAARQLGADVVWDEMIAPLVVAAE